MRWLRFGLGQWGWKDVDEFQKYSADISPGFGDAGGGEELRAWDDSVAWILWWWARCAWKESVFLCGLIPTFMKQEEPKISSSFDFCFGVCKPKPKLKDRRIWPLFFLTFTGKLIIGYLDTSKHVGDQEKGKLLSFLKIDLLPLSNRCLILCGGTIPAYRGGRDGNGGVNTYDSDSDLCLIPAGLGYL